MKTMFIAAAALAMLVAAPPVMAASQSHNVVAANDSQRDKRAKAEARKKAAEARARQEKAQRNRRDAQRDYRRDRRWRDVHEYRRNYWAPRRYHWNVYRRPPGWYYRRWIYGERLPRAWFIRDYWIVNYLAFGLIAPPPGYVWVRVGNDAMLVNTETGEVLRVVYNLYY